MQKPTQTARTASESKPGPLVERGRRTYWGQTVPGKRISLHSKGRLSFHSKGFPYVVRDLIL